ncbi:hypothetical protein [Paracoccus sp. KR1-242]|uniref:hypothetical protein n=1 Tax=Paracoccus sp. KR1-242 TaxID=3410028 RepID=UPI003C0EE1AD
MTEDMIESAKRSMLINVPLSDDSAEPGLTISPVSLGLREVDETGLTFRLIDEQGMAVDLILNPVLAKAMQDCIALARHIEPGLSTGLS